MDLKANNGKNEIFGILLNLFHVKQCMFCAEFCKKSDEICFT